MDSAADVPFVQCGHGVCDGSGGLLGSGKAEKGSGARDQVEVEVEKTSSGL